MNTCSLIPYGYLHICTILVYNRGMNVKALEAYITTLMQQRGLQVQEVTAMAGVKDNYLWRLRNNQIKSPGVAVLRALIIAVKGNINDLSKLLMDDMTEAEAQRLARRWIDADKIDQYRANAAVMSDEELDAAIRDLETEIKNDPSLLQALRVFLAGWRAGRE